MILGVTEPIELNTLSADQVLGLRKNMVNSSPQLLGGDYVPSPEVFSELKSGGYWYGLKGYAFYGRGENSVLGKAIESRLLLTPYLLVSPEFWGLTIWYEKNLKWDPNKVTEQDLDRSDFPYYPKAHSFIWHPSEGRAEISYHLSDYIQQLNRYAEKELTVAQASFSLISYNALDFGYRYMYAAMGESSNIVNPNDRGKAFKVLSGFFTTDGCGYAAGCNISYDLAGTPSTFFRVFRFSDLPAKLVVKLWREAPADINIAPDVRFEINFD
ncbi:MAG: hypothetical protein K1X83_10255 [Oligoflexia bacterium]|nr:hypothetical protein [Oligoflexia bacterium]